jgi:hypothetical protein
MKKTKPKVIPRIIPSQNAVRWCASMLRRNQYRAAMEAILSQRLGDKKLEQSFLEQANDYEQGARFLEGMLLK